MNLGLSFHNHLWFAWDKSSIYRVRCENTLTVHAIFARGWCQTLSCSCAAAWFLCPCLPFPHVLRVIVLVRAVVNPLRTLFTVFNLASDSLWDCNQSQSGVQKCSLGGQAMFHHPGLWCEKIPFSYLTPRPNDGYSKEYSEQLHVVFELPLPLIHHYQSLFFALPLDHYQLSRHEMRCYWCATFIFGKRF